LYWLTEWAKPIVIMDNYINRLILSKFFQIDKFIITRLYLMYALSSFAYCSHSVNGVSLTLFQSDHIKCYWNWLLAINNLLVVFKSASWNDHFAYFYQYLPMSLSYRYDYPHNNNLLDIFKRAYQLLMYRSWLIYLFVAPNAHA